MQSKGLLKRPDIRTHKYNAITSAECQSIKLAPINIDVGISYYIIIQ